MFWNPKHRTPHARAAVAPQPAQPLRPAGAASAEPATPGLRHGGERRLTPLTPEQYRLTQDALDRASLRWIGVR